MYKKSMPQRYGGFKMIAEDGTPVPAPWKKFNGFIVKGETADKLDEAIKDDLSPTPNKKVELVNRVLSSMNNSHHQMDVDDINR